MTQSDDGKPATPLLDRIDSPADLKTLAREDLPALAAELRAVILDTVAQTGGHLGSGMGVVELTIALHYIFDFKKDRLVWDVGHQCYPHKLLTERKESFHTLRQKDGLSGFSNRFESPYDAYLMGHAGTATSAALGISMADRLLDVDRHVVAVVGDAAMGCGVAFEALNHAGSLEDGRLLVILNDNKWSIAQTVGALSRYLNRVRSGSLYNQAKKRLHHLIQSIPVIGKDIDDSLGQGVEMLRNILDPGHIFEELGFQYFGPVDGHDVGEVVKIFERVRDRDGLVLVHTKTEKGKGVPGSQEKYDRAHAAKPKPVPVEPKIILPASAPKKKGRSWTAWFSEGIDELAQQDSRVLAITAAMPDGTGLMEFREKFPDRFIDAGIAEQHAVALSSGLATAGMRPVVAIYSTFLQRGYDQVFQEVLLQGVPVMFCMDRAGLVGEDGATHNGAFDIAFLRTIPGIVLMAPKDGLELKEMMAFGLTLETSCGIRYGRGRAPEEGELAGWHGRRQEIELGKSETLREGRDGAILVYGHMASIALDAAEELAGHGLSIEVVNARFVKPLDEACVLDLAERHDHVVTLEDHSVLGGFGSAIIETVARHGPMRARFDLMGMPDCFPKHMSRSEVLEEVGLDVKSVVRAFLARKAVRDLSPT